MRMTYYTSVHLDEYNAPAEHVRGFCVALAATGNHYSLVRPSVTPLGDRELEWVTEGDVPLWYPKIRGGWRIFETLVHRYIRSGRDRDSDVAYFRFTPSLKIARALSERSDGSFRVLELNGSAGMTSAVFRQFTLAMDLVLVDSPEMCARVTSLLGDEGPRVAVHKHPATNTAVFRPIPMATARTQLNLPQTGPVILHVSGFQRHHDFATVIESVAQLVPEFPDILLALAGDGPRHDEIAAMATERLGASHLIMPGSMPPERVAMFIGAANVCVNTLTSEVLRDGNLRAFKLYEYMACARPVIEAIDETRALPDWARDYLYLIPAESTSATTTAIRDIIAQPDPWAKRSSAGRGYVERYRTWDAAVKETLGIVTAMRQSREATVG